MLSFDSLKLKSVTELSHNTSKFTFEFPDANQVAGLQVASCLVVKADLPVKDPKTGEVAVKPVIRPYTPTSTVEQKGSLDLVVKVYPDGVMSQHFKSLKVGDALAFKGPFPKIAYEANKWNHVGLVAGGTGITPMYQVIQAALNDEKDKTRFTLLFANVAEEDILLRKELEGLQAKNPSRFKINYTLDRPSATWKGFKGHVTDKIYKESGLPTATDEKSIVFVCGPPGFMKAVSGDKAEDKSQGEILSTSLLGKLGFGKDQVFKF